MMSINCEMQDHDFFSVGYKNSCKKASRKIPESLF